MVSLTRLINLSDFACSFNLKAMQTVNSISGGSSSAFMAFHHPAEINIFACVLTMDKATRINDKAIRSYAASKLPNHDWDYSGSRELDATLLSLMKLEQIIQGEIIWVSSHLTYDEMIGERAALPNSRSRFCTIELKINPILSYLYFHHYQGEPFLMQIGFRSDENRDTNLCSILKIPTQCSIKSHRQKWSKVDIREAIFPLISSQVTKQHVLSWADSVGLSFPLVSNCDFCFNHTKSQLMNQAALYPERMKWWINAENTIGKTWSGSSKPGGCDCA